METTTPNQLVPNKPQSNAIGATFHDAEASHHSNRRNSSSTMEHHSTNHPLMTNTALHSTTNFLNYDLQLRHTILRLRFPS